MHKQHDSYFGRWYNKHAASKHGMQIHETEVDITLYSTEKESLQSDVRLRRNRRPKFQQNNNFRQT